MVKMQQAKKLHYFTQNIFPPSGFVLCVDQCIFISVTVFVVKMQGHSCTTTFFLSELLRVYETILNYTTTITIYLMFLMGWYMFPVAPLFCTIIFLKCQYDHLLKEITYECLTTTL